MLIGGGNSAGQAVVFLASHAEHVHLFIRGASLDHSMSHYLTERIAALPNVTLHTRIELTALEGDARLERVHYRDADGVEGKHDDASSVRIHRRRAEHRLAQDMRRVARRARGSY